MPRFFLHLREGDRLLSDLEGRDHPSLAEAREEAITAARELMSDKVADRMRPDLSRFEIADETGAIVLVVPFEDAIGGD